jgi:hypothetical protein
MRTPGCGRDHLDPRSAKAEELALHRELRSEQAHAFQVEAVRGLGP